MSSSLLKISTSGFFFCGRAAFAGPDGMRFQNADNISITRNRDGAVSGFVLMSNQERPEFNAPGYLTPGGRKSFGGFEQGELCVGAATSNKEARPCVAERASRRLLSFSGRVSGRLHVGC